MQVREQTQSKFSKRILQVTFQANTASRRRQQNNTIFIEKKNLCYSKLILKPLEKIIQLICKCVKKMYCSALRLSRSTVFPHEICSLLTVACMTEMTDCLVTGGYLGFTKCIKREENSSCKFGALQGIKVLRAGANYRNRK